MTGLIGDIDASRFALDEPLPELPPTQGSTSRQQLIYEQARREGLTVRQLYLSVTGARGHRLLIGTPREVADQMEEWFSGGGCDGFNIMPSHLPDGLDDFVELVIPELQRRRLFRTEYEGMTLRENLGLPRPQNRFLAQDVAGSQLRSAAP